MMVTQQSMPPLTALEAEALAYKLMGFADEVSEREWSALVSALLVAGVHLPEDRAEATRTRWYGFTG